MAHPSTIIMFLLLSLHTTRAHFVDANANYDYKVEKVSGIDEKEGLIVEKLKAFLLGLRSFQGRNEAGSDGENEFVSSSSSSLSPTPSPCSSPSMESEVPVPSAAPAEAVNVHPLAGHNLPPHPFLGYREESTKRVVAAVAGATILVCVACFICVCWKWKWRRHRRKNGSRDVTRPRKVSVNPALDLIYLNSLDMDLELQTSCPKKDFENVKTSPDHTLDEDEEQPKKEQCDGNASSVLSVLDQDSVKHDTTIHVDPQLSHDEDEEEDDDDEDEDLAKHCNDDTAIHVDPPPSDDDDDEEEEEDDDDDSFHSFCDSHSSHLRLSNASIGSLSDGSEVKSSHLRLSNASIGSLSDKTEISSQKNSPSKSSHCLDVGSSPSAASDNQPIPPPPPPPPPPLTPKPPLPADSNIPPPPCPPPFPKANGKGPPPPPPLSPLGKQGSPLPKLKPLHWDKVRATPDRSMVWDNMRSNSFELDEEMMESLFGYKSMKEDAKSKTPSPGQHILDHKRLQNITILSKALNASSEQICYALIQGQGLCLQQLEALAKMVPTKEEEMKLCSYKGDINELVSAERFVKAVLGVPLAFLRIEAMLYRETFEDEVIHLSNSFSMLQEACKELRSSRLFLKLLEAVLKTGNRMNVGTIRGGAKAFKLDTLLKLADVKGTDGRTTLLHFVVQEIIRSEGVRVSESIMGKMSSLAKTADEREEEYTRMGLELVSGLSTELYNVKKTATIDLDVLASSVSNLSDGMAKLNQLVDKELRWRENGGNFVTSMKAFSSVAGKKLEELQADESNVMVHVRQVTEYFHGELSKSDTNPLRIFVIVRDFLGMLDHVCKELRSYKPPISPNPLASFR